MSPFWPHGAPIEIQAEDREVNAPQAEPHSFLWEGRLHRIQELSAHWRIHTYWWTEVEIWRDYWKVVTDTGLLCVLYQDLTQGHWYLERIYQ